MKDRRLIMKTQPVALLAIADAVAAHMRAAAEQGWPLTAAESATQTASLANGHAGGLNYCCCEIRGHDTLHGARFVRVRG
jgi:hypothetical protein